MCISAQKNFLGTEFSAFFLIGIEFIYENY